MSEVAGFIVCRSARPPERIARGALTGYQCKICSEPLQVTPEGLLQMRARKLIVLCNPCGFEMSQRLVEDQKEGRGGGVDFVLSQAAQDYLKRQGLDPEQLFQEGARGRIDTVHCVLCNREHTAKEGERIDCPCGASFRLMRTGGGV